ncbi:MAG: C_GCAxxG_C_C family protein [Clostridiaceae bacterium]|nr:C_GCAxxG_C_C family protein [Clostridiaceae bacterium]
MSEKMQKARELHESGFNCSQSVLGSFCDQFGIDEQILMKLAGGFGGGLQCGEVCGAVSGAVMVVGLKYGQSIANDKDSKKKCYEITSEFMEEFLKRKGTVLCREILGYDIRDPEAKAKYPDRQKQICPKVIETAVLILEEMGF